MIYDVTKTEYGIEGKMHCTLFDEEIEVMMEESVICSMQSSVPPI